MHNIKIIEPNSKWKIRAWEYAPQKFKVMTGFDNGITFDWMFDILEDKIITMPNFEFDAALKLVNVSKGSSSHTYVLKDSDGINIYQTGSIGMACIFSALLARKIAGVSTNWFSGKWFFKKQGKAVYLFPRHLTDFDNSTTLFQLYRALKF